MPVNGMSTGVDYTIAYYDGTAQTLINLGDVQMVDIKASHHVIKSQPYNDVPRYGYVPDGFHITFTITRAGPDIEDFMVALAQQFNAGNVQKPGVLNQTIQNPDGTLSKYQYTGCVLFLTDHGNISREKTVTLALEGYASDKRKIS